MSLRENDSIASQTFAALVVGLGIGFGLGVLFAPNSGRKTRAAIAKKADRSLDEIKDLVEDVTSSASDLLERGLQGVQEHKENVARGFEQAKKAYRKVAG